MEFLNQLKNESRQPPADTMLRRLRVGQRWLAEEHHRYLAEDSRAATDERFSTALAAWDALERVFRCSGYKGCIWGEGQRCPPVALVVCDGCVGLGKVEVETVPQVAQLGLAIGGAGRAH